LNSELNEKQIKELLGRYVDGTASETERKQIEAWYQSFDEHDTTAAVFSSPDEEQQEYDSVLSKIHDQILPLQKNISPFSKPRLITRVRVAAIAAFFLIVAGATHFYFRASQAVPEIAKLNLAVAEAGKMKLIELADGSKIWLNSSSKLSYPDRFSANLREVTLLEGEAFFEIAHENKLPFIVHSKGVNTQVLGTSFNINAYKYSKDIEVTVNTGKVAVSVGNDLIDYLTPNEQIKYQLLTGKILKESVKNSRAPWMNGDIVLDQVDFESLKAILFDNYKYVLKNKGKHITGLHFSATLKKSDEIKNVMKLLSSINRTKYRLSQNPNEITMY
jgi:transmembrane sensor